MDRWAQGQHNYTDHGKVTLTFTHDLALSMCPLLCPWHLQFANPVSTTVPFFADAEKAPGLYQCDWLLIK